MKRRIVPTLVRLARRVRAHVFQASPEEEVDEELAFHVEMRVREHLRKGLSLAEARRRAEDRFDDLDAVKAACRRIAERRERKMRMMTWWDDLRQDAGYAVRQLRRNPGFALVAVLTLALGIGANTAVFSVVNGVLLKPLPYEEPDRLVQIWTRYLPESGFDIPRFPISPPELLDYREQNASMEAVGYFTTGSRTLTGSDGPPVRLDLALVDDAVFPILGVRPELGRWIRPEEDEPGTGVVVLSHGLWVDRFGADPGIVGRTITLSGRTKEVVGVMPREFSFPDESVEAWESFGMDEAAPPGRGSHFIRGIARLKEGITLEGARAEVQSIHAGWADEYRHNVAHFPILHRLENDVVEADVRRILHLLLAAVGIVLLVACVNVANLYLARAERRQREVALRGALGAGRGRVIRQFLTESAVLAGAGGVLGVLSAGWLTRAILAVNPDALPRMSGIEVSAPVLAFTAAVTLGTAVLFGVLPAIWAGRRARVPSAGGERGATGGPGHGRFRRFLVGTEVAMSVVVLVAAGLLVRSFDALTAVDPGIDPEGVLTFRISPVAAEGPSDADVRTFYRELLERLRGLPGVTLASAGGQVPLTEAGNRNDFAIRGRPPRQEGELALNAQTIDVRAGYFEALGIPLRRGRIFTDADGPSGPPVAVVNEELVRLYFPDGDPIGELVGYPWVSDSTWMRVVGVVGDVHASLDQEPLPQLYRVHDQSALLFGEGSTFPVLHVVLRTTVPPTSLVGAVRAAVRELDPNVAVADPRSMRDVLDRSVAEPRLARNLLAAFGILALVLAAVGIYGVVSYTVARRTREIGVRIALGAGASRVSGLMVREGAVPAVAGVGLGLLGALALGGAVRELLFGVSPTDPLTLAAAPLLLLGVAVVASWIPARRATRIQPTEALAAE